MFKLLFLPTWEAMYWPTDSGNVRVARRKATMLEYRAFLHRHIQTGRHICTHVAIKTYFKINHFYSFNFTKISWQFLVHILETEVKFCKIFCRMEVINSIVWPLLHWQVPFQKSPRLIIFKISRSAAFTTCRWVYFPQFLWKCTHLAGNHANVFHSCSWFKSISCWTHW